MSLILAVGTAGIVGVGLGFLGGNQYNKIAQEKNADGSSKYGWLPDLPDVRDFVYTAPMATNQPDALSLMDFCPPVQDQSTAGSCTGNSTAEAIAFWLNKIGKGNLTQASMLSRLFIYYNGRLSEGTQKTDSGAAIRDVVKMVAKYGAPLETDWPYDLSKVTTKPNAKAYKDGLKDLIKKYSRLTTNADRVGCLAAGYPFVAGFTVYTEFESQQVATSGIVPMPAKGSKVLGGHAILVIGYDKKAQTYLCRNSWGANWGMKGNFTIPMAYLDNPNLSDDHWVING